MCIIVVKNKNVEMPKIETLKKCFSSNPDGAGFMYASRNRVHIKKGFMTFESFKNALNDLEREIDTKKTAIVFHFRISTQAGINAQNCHPYPLSSNLERLHKLNDCCKIGVAHNGIIDFAPDDKNYNDTQFFIADYLTEIIKSEYFYTNSKTINIIEALLGGVNKLAIMTSSGHIERLGSGWIYNQKDNCYYSNNGFRAVTYYRTNNAYNYVNDYDFDDYAKECASDKIRYVSKTADKQGGFATFILYNSMGDIIDYHYIDLNKAKKMTARDIVTDYNAVNDYYKLEPDDIVEFVGVER